MLKPIRVSAPDDKVWFWSDLHYNHDKDFIWGPRGFKGVTESNKELVRRWNAVIDDKSTVFHLGDLIFKADADAFWDLIAGLRFDHLYLLLGNHVSGHKAAYQEVLRAQFPEVVAAQGEVYPLSSYTDDGSRGVHFLPQYAEVEAPGLDVVLCHYPISSWNAVGHGTVHLHGHTHGNHTIKLARRFDIGVEAQPHPLSLAELKRRVANVPPPKVDHHGPHTT